MDTNPDTNPDRNQQTATYLSRPQCTYPDRNVPIQTATDNDRTPWAKRVCDWLRDFKLQFLIYRYVDFYVGIWLIIFLANQSFFKTPPTTLRTPRLPQIGEATKT